jgi:hypothetical protein
VTEKEDLLKEIRIKMDENQKLLREIARWSRFQNIGKLKEVLVAENESTETKATHDKESLEEVQK